MLYSPMSELFSKFKPMAATNVVSILNQIKVCTDIKKTDVAREKIKHITRPYMDTKDQTVSSRMTICILMKNRSSFQIF